TCAGGWASARHRSTPATVGGVVRATVGPKGPRTGARAGRTGGAESGWVGPSWAGPTVPARPPAAAGPAVAEDEAHRLGARRRVAPLAAHGRRDRARAGLPDAAHRHAQVLALHDDDRAAWLEHLHERVGDLRREPLLHL